MNVLRLFLIALTCTLSLNAQVVQKVQVLEYQEGEKKTPLKGVEVVANHAASTVSNEKGEVTLQFRTQHEGDRVQLRRLSKSGYELFNKTAVEQWTISNSETFRLVMCPSDRFSRLCKEYWNVSSDSYRRQYERDQQQLTQLHRQQKLKEEEYKAQLAQLEEQFNTQLNNLENYVEQFARIDLSELNKKEKKVIGLVKEGRMDEAIALYEEYGFLEKYNQQTSDILKIDQARAELSRLETEKRQARAQVQAALRRQISTYQLAGGRDNFRKATDLFMKAAMADTTNLPLLFDYAEFAYNQSEYHASISAIEIYLRNITNDSYHTILALQLRSRLGMELREFELSIQNLKKALELSHQMTQQGQGEQVDYVTCQLYNNLIDIYTAMGKEENEVLMKEFEPRLDSLYKEQPDTYYLEMAQFCYNRGLHIALSGQYSEGLPYLEKAAGILEPYVNKENKNRVVEDVITATFYYLPVILARMDENEKALTYQKMNMDRLERLFSKNPNSYAVSMFPNYGNLANIYANLKRFEEAEVTLLKAEEALEKIKSITGAWHEYEFGLLNIRFRVYQQKEDVELCCKYGRMAIQKFATLPDWTQNQYAPQKTKIQQYLEEHGR